MTGTTLMVCLKIYVSSHSSRSHLPYAISLSPAACTANPRGASDRVIKDVHPDRSFGTHSLESHLMCCTSSLMASPNGYYIHPRESMISKRHRIRQSHRLHIFLLPTQPHFRGTPPTDQCEPFQFYLHLPKSITITESGIIQCI